MAHRSIGAAGLWLAAVRLVAGAVSGLVLLGISIGVLVFAAMTFIVIPWAWMMLPPALLFWGYGGAYLIKQDQEKQLRRTGIRR